MKTLHSWITSHLETIGLSFSFNNTTEFSEKIMARGEKNQMVKSSSIKMS